MDRTGHGVIELGVGDRGRTGQVDGTGEFGIRERELDRVALVLE
ncbi:Uncharacterised protein [Mycobacteroides abscessus subsp. abscessus]|nr:Uncharacterised protein [Mycobacteroides abscessus subsp. abscessus]